MNVYQKYSNLLDHTAKHEITAFLKEKHSLEGFSKVITFPSKIYTEHFLFLQLTFAVYLLCQSLLSSLNLQKIESGNHLWKEIASLRVTVPLSMFCLYAGKLNEDLCDRAERLNDKIIMFEVEENRELNKG